MCSLQERDLFIYISMAYALVSVECINFAHLHNAINVFRLAVCVSLYLEEQEK